MEKRHIGAAILLGGVALGLVGCSVSIAGVTGLTVSGGHVHALVRMCPGTTADEVHMIPTAGQFVLIPHPSWQFDKTESASVDLGKTSEFLRLVGHDEQGFQSSSPNGAGGYLRFKKSDVESLQPGQILASVSTSADSTVVDADGFSALAKELCAKF